MNNFMRKMMIEKNHERYLQEKTLNGYDGAISSNKYSRDRIDIMMNREKISLWYLLKQSFNMIWMMPYFVRAIKGIDLSFEKNKDIPAKPLEEVSGDFLKSFEEKAFSYGIDSIGYTKIDPKYIFKDRAVLFENVIIFTKAMEKKPIINAPNRGTLRTVWKTYDELGQISIELSEYLNKKGYGAQAGPALSGLTIYPALAEKAGLGIVGRHGLLITPENGPIVRIAVIYTSIKNLPTSENKHLWIKDFCKTCGSCIKNCPPGAIYEEKKKHPDGLVSSVDSKKCMDYFFDHYGCSVCLKVCPFTKTGYDKLRKVFVK